MTTSTRLVMGIDCGGTKTTALLSDRPGRVIAMGTGGPANFQTDGIETAQRALDAAVAEAFDRAGILFVSPAALCLGLAGVGRSGDDAWALDWAVGRGWNGHVKIVNDTELILWAGLPAGWGVAVVSGTGSMVFGRAPDGRVARAGGWGPLLGDEGSGYMLGADALRAVARAADKRAESTCLTDLVLKRLRLDDPSQLIQTAYRDGLSRQEVASLAVLVETAAGQADPTALEIEDQAAAELALAFTTVARQLQFTGAVPCALGGGVMVHYHCLAAGVIAKATQPQCWPDPVQIVTRPADGALRLAWKEIAPWQD